jgi:hypothetical protein
MPNMMLEIPAPDRSAMTMWIASARVAVHPDRPPQIMKPEAVLAMIRAVMENTAATGAALEVLRQDQEPRA